MGACLSKNENLFDKVVLQSIFLDFLIRNVEVDNDWEGSADAIEGALQLVSPDQLNKLEHEDNAWLMADDDLELTISLSRDSTQKAVFVITRGSAFMFSPFHSLNTTISLSFSSESNKRKSVVVANRKILSAILKGANKSPDRTQLEICMNTPVGDILSTNPIFADMSVQQYDMLQPFVYWRYIESNSNVFCVEGYEDLDSVLGLHILIDGSCVVLDDPMDKAAAEAVSGTGTAGSRQRRSGGSASNDNTLTQDKSLSQGPRVIDLSEENKLRALDDPTGAAAAATAAAALATTQDAESAGDMDLQAMISDAASMKAPELRTTSANGAPTSAQRQSGVGKKKHKSHAHHGPCHSFTRCLPCLGGKSNAPVYAADGSAVNYHGKQVGIVKDHLDSSNSMYAASVYTGESEYLAYGATAGLGTHNPSTSPSASIFSGFSTKAPVNNRMNRLSSKKSIVGPGANYAANHNKNAGNEQVSYQGHIPDVGNIYNKGSVLAAELSLIDNNVVQMAKVETLERSVFAVLTPAALGLIEQSGKQGAAAVASIRENWRVKLLKRMKKTIPFLCDINHREMAVLAKKVTLHSFTSPDVIFAQGDAGDMFYIVIHGNVGIYQVPKARIKMLQEANAKHRKSVPAVPTEPTASGGWAEEKPTDPSEKRSQSVHCLRTLGKGAYFGEISLVAGRERVATAVATPGTILMGMDKKTFLSLFMERRTILTELRLKLLPPDVPIPLILVLQHSRGYNMLLRFLKKELAQENILFWKEVDRLEEFIRSKIRWVKTSRPDTGPDAVVDFDQPSGSDYTIPVVQLHRPLLIMAERVGQIVDKFVHTNSPLQINIPDGMCKELLSNYDLYFSEGMRACAGEVDVAGVKAAAAGPPPTKLDPTELNIRNISKVLCSRGMDAAVGVVDSEQQMDITEKKPHEAMMEIKEESLEEQEQNQAKTAKDLNAEESKEELPAQELVDMLEMLLRMFTRAKREVLLMLGHDGYKRWQETKTYAEFRALITPYVGVPEGHVNQIAENTKEMFVQVDTENAK